MSAFCPGCGAEIRPDEPPCEVADLRFDASGVAKVGGKTLPLTHQEYRIIRALAKAYPQQVTRDTLLIAGLSDAESVTVLSVVMFRIRAKLRDAGSAARIASVWGVGYRLEVAA